ncbi:MAG: tol-pal system-associated acyl-CoA thioesterase [Rhodospirillales bacterium]
MNSAAPETLSLRVYYEDTDAGGIVYHAAYLRFAERGRTEFVRKLGIDQQQLRAETGSGFVVTSLTIDYLKPAFLDDNLTITTEIDRIRPASVNFKQTVARESQIIAHLKVRVACLDGDGRLTRLPRAFAISP